MSRLRLCPVLTMYFLLRICSANAWADPCCVVAPRGFHAVREVKILLLEENLIGSVPCYCLVRTGGLLQQWSAFAQIGFNPLLSFIAIFVIHGTFRHGTSFLG